MEGKFRSNEDELRRLEREGDSKIPLIIAFVVIGIILIGSYLLV